MFSSEIMAAINSIFALVKLKHSTHGRQIILNNDADQLYEISQYILTQYHINLPIYPFITQLLNKINRIAVENVAQLLEFLLATNNPIALFNLSMIYENGIEDSILKDLSKSLNFLQSATDADDPIALIKSGYFYYYGIEGHIPQAQEQAIRYFLQAAQQGNAVAQATLSAIYFNGIPDLIEPNLEEAYKFAELGANQSHPRAQYNLGVMLSQGIPNITPPDKIKGLYLIELAAQNGYSPAPSQLGKRTLSQGEFSSHKKFFSRLGPTTIGVRWRSSETTEEDLCEAMNISLKMGTELSKDPEYPYLTSHFKNEISEEVDSNRKARCKFTK